MGNLGTFDARTVEPNTRDVLPAGEYEACIVASELKPTAAGTGHYLSLDLQVLSGEHQNRHIFDRLNIDNPSAQAKQIALGTLSAICRAVGVLTPQDSSELHNKPLRVKVKIKKSDEFGDQNEVVGYKPRHNGQPKPAPSPQAPAAPVADNNPAPWE